MAPKRAKHRFSPARLRQARGKRRIETVAAAVRVSARTILNYETGRTLPDADTVARLAELYGRSIRYFYETAA